MCTYMSMYYSLLLSLKRQVTMSKEAKTQAKVNVGVENLWTAIAKDYSVVVPNALPNIVSEVEVIEGDGGLGTILLFKFIDEGTSFSGKTRKHQKEKIVEYEESSHQIGLQVIEGGKLDVGFLSYTTFFKMTSISDHETLVDVKVVYEANVEDSSSKPLETTGPTLFYLKCLENYLLNLA